MSSLRTVSLSTNFVFLNLIKNHESIQFERNLSENAYSKLFQSVESPIESNCELDSGPSKLLVATILGLENPLSFDYNQVPVFLFDPSVLVTIIENAHNLNMK